MSAFDEILNEVEHPTVSDAPTQQTQQTLPPSPNVMVFAQNSAELFILRDIINSSLNVRTAQVRPNSKNVGPELVKFLNDNSVPTETMYTDFNTMSIDDMAHVLNETTVNMVVFTENTPPVEGKKTHKELCELILSRISQKLTKGSVADRVRVEYYGHETDRSSVTAAYYDTFNLGSHFTNSDVAKEYRDSAEFREKLFTVYVGEISYHQTAAGFVSARLLKTTLSALNDVFIPYRLSNINRYRNTIYSLTTTGLISCDFHYGDGADFTNFLRTSVSQTTKNDEGETITSKIYEKVNYFLLLARGYNTVTEKNARATYVRFVNYNPAHNQEFMTNFSSYLTNVTNTSGGNGSTVFEAYTNQNQDTVVDYIVGILSRVDPDAAVPPSVPVSQDAQPASETEQAPVVPPTPTAPVEVQQLSNQPDVVPGEPRIQVVE